MTKENEPKPILVVDSTPNSPSAELIKQKLGDDKVIIVSPEEIKGHNLVSEKRISKEEIILKAPKKLEQLVILGGFEKSGREKRRERRKKARRLKK